MNIDVPKSSSLEEVKEKFEKMKKENLGEVFLVKEDIDIIIKEMNALVTEISKLEEVKAKERIFEMAALKDKIFEIEKKYEIPTTSESEIKNDVILINELCSKLKELEKQEIEYLKRKLKMLEEENLGKTFTNEQESKEILDKMNSIGLKINELESKFITE